MRRRISDSTRVEVWLALRHDRNHVLRQIGEAVSEGACGWDVRRFLDELDAEDRAWIAALADAIDDGDGSTLACLLVRRAKREAS